jgi:hypothetical protein
MTEYQDRRSVTTAELILLIEQIQANQMTLNDRLTQHMTSETHELAEAITSLMKEAFPDGDPDGHRRRHELELEVLKDKAEFWKKMRLALAQWGLLGFIGWIAITAWNAFLLGPHK